MYNTIYTTQTINEEKNHYSPRHYSFHIFHPPILFPIFPSNPLLVSYSINASKVNFNPSTHANETKWSDLELGVPNLMILLSAQPIISHKLLVKFVALNFTSWFHKFINYHSMPNELYFHC